MDRDVFEQRFSEQRVALSSFPRIVEHRFSVPSRTPVLGAMGRAGGEVMWVTVIALRAILEEGGGTEVQPNWSWEVSAPVARRQPPPPDSEPGPRPGSRAGRRPTTSHASIEETAFRLFREHRFEATTVQTIDSQCGIGRRTLFRYFECMTGDVRTALCRTCRSDHFSEWDPPGHSRAYARCAGGRLWFRTSKN